MRKYMKVFPSLLPRSVFVFSDCDAACLTCIGPGPSGCTTFKTPTCPASPGDWSFRSCVMYRHMIACACAVNLAFAAATVSAGTAQDRTACILTLLGWANTTALTTPACRSVTRCICVQLVHIALAIHVCTGVNRARSNRQQANTHAHSVRTGCVLALHMLSCAHKPGCSNGSPTTALRAILAACVLQVCPCTAVAVHISLRVVLS